MTGSSLQSGARAGSSTTSSTTGTELTDLVQRERDRVDDMQRMWQEWASRCGVISWPLPEGEKRTRYQGVSFWPSRAYSRPANFLSRRGQ